MKKYLLVLLSAVTLYSCVNIIFKNPQPLNSEVLSEFPISMRGKYLSIPQDSLSDTATILIDKKYYAEINALEKNEKNFISDSLILKKYKNQYFVNLKVKNKPYWYIAIIKPLNKSDYTLWLIDEENTKALEKMEQFTDVKLIKNEVGDVTSYILNPSNSELEKILAIDSLLINTFKLKKLKD